MVLEGKQNAQHTANAYTVHTELVKNVYHRRQAHRLANANEDKSQQSIGKNPCADEQGYSSIKNSYQNKRQPAFFVCRHFEGVEVIAFIQEPNGRGGQAKCSQKQKT